MCGIAGFIDTSYSKKSIELTKIAALMANSLQHRGPDSQGVWVNKESGIALGHRRLSIIDLSEEGRQPMASYCGRYMIIFNGEIYNFKILRKELEEEGFKFRSQTDTEVMLTAISRYGLEHAVRKFTGMFAFALWDQEEHVLHLVRDRLGEKPLYYGWNGNAFLFASELKAFKAYPNWTKEINRNALALYLRYNCIPAPHSIYQNIFKLTPGTIVTLTRKDTIERRMPLPQAYWTAKEAIERSQGNPLTSSINETTEQLDLLLRNIIRNQMLSDVPLGAFLSGGIDSSAIVALMQTQSSQPVKTFTIGFSEPGYNEAHHARAIAQHLGTKHTEFYVTAKEALAVIPKLPTIYDEPFSDSSQIPTLLISQLTRQYVTVSLSGDGGDELFAGYNRYFQGKKIWEKTNWWPYGMRLATSKIFTAVSPYKWNKFFSFITPLLPKKFRIPAAGDALYKVALTLAARKPEEAYAKLASHWDNPEKIVAGANERNFPGINLGGSTNIKDFVQQMMYQDTINYLPNDILTKVDRAAMSVSLETRIPFLDHQLLEFAWKIPLSMKIRQGEGKWILKQVLYKYVPKKLIERPKQGFGIPLDTWLRGPLQNWAENLLNKKRLEQAGLLNAGPIRQKWAEHLSGKRNWQYQLWDILMFEAWLDAEKR